MGETADTLQRLLDDPEVQAAADNTSAPEQALHTSTSLLGTMPPDLAAKLPALMGALGPMLGASSEKKNEKTELLLALKPYMSQQRCEAIDKLIILGRIGEVFKQLR